MTAFILLAFWACWPGLKGGYFYPKAFMVLLGFILYQLRDSPRSVFFLLVMAASTAFSILPNWSVFGATEVWTYGLAQMTVYLLLMTMPTKGSWLRWAGVLLSAHALLQLTGHDPLITHLPQGRAVAWIGSPIDLSAILAMAAPASGPWLPLVMAGIWACGSRGAAVAVLFAFASNRVRWLLLPLLLWPVFSAQPKDVARVEMGKMAWAGFLERPWLGQGPSTFGEIFDRKRTERLTSAVGISYRQHHAHNDILEMLCSTGALGLIAYLILLWPLRRSQSLVALFVLLKYNPVSFEVWCCAALIAANELQKRNGPSGLQSLGADSLVPRTAFSAVPAGAGLGLL